MEQDGDNSPRAVGLAFAAGCMSLLLISMSLQLALRKFGLVWKGEVFGNERFNWKDAGFFGVPVLGAFIGLTPTKLYLDHRKRKSRCIVGFPPLPRRAAPPVPRRPLNDGESEMPLFESL